MLTLVTPYLLRAVAVCLLFTAPVMAAEGLTGNLVDVKWLEKNRTHPNVLILDASPAQIYAANHIPGAIGVDFLTYGFPERPLADMQQRYQSWGISPGKQIVMYDQGGSIMATRLFFSLYYHGFPAKDLLVLNGGLAKWQEQGLPLTKDPTPPPPKGSFKIEKLNEEARVKLPEFLTASGDPAKNVLLEALDADWHFGEVLAFGRAGHIPNAVMLPSADFFNPDKTFKSADEIGRMLTYLGIGPEQRIHTHCGGGVAASVPFFALKFILNYPKVTLFTESAMGWLSDARELPYWTYDAPFLMRDAKWLQSWGGRMLRMYVGAQVSIVDVRPAAAYGLGHVPFALSLPSEVFRSHLAEPGKLAEVLGSAGVNPLHEAVVVSGAGLTTDSALAFLILDKLGQKKVSVLMDSLDQWSKLGFGLSKDPTLVGPRKSPQDVSVSPAVYSERVRDGVIITDLKSTRGVYPRVFIASGKNVPATSVDGTVVHVAYTDVVNENGTPKSAKEIWKTLTKAGVPRYAELVCYSDDPGEAAVNYFILKMMGYPDVKVWVSKAVSE